MKLHFLSAYYPAQIRIRSKDPGPDGSCSRYVPYTEPVEGEFNFTLIVVVFSIGLA